MIRLKADLEEKRPFEEGVQRKSEEDEVSTFIFRISLTLEASKREFSKGIFQEEFEEKRSLTESMEWER
jgi:hypothetical protein